MRRPPQRITLELDFEWNPSAPGRAHPQCPCAGALFIGWDAELRCPESGRAAVANTSDLNEELGQVQVLFSDKTGTLTNNLMLFKMCSVRGRIYEERDSKLYDIERLDAPVDTMQVSVGRLVSL